PGAKGERKELSGGRISEPLHALLSYRCKKALCGTLQGEMFCDRERYLCTDSRREEKGACRGCGPVMSSGSAVRRRNDRTPGFGRDQYPSGEQLVNANS